MNLVIVESAAKAKTINKYLGDKFKVIASIGHVRDIKKKNGIDVNKDFKINYEDNVDKAKQLSEIKKNLKKANKIYLATDQDREGEAIAWHINSILAENNNLQDIEVHRITFTEITKKAINLAIDNPRNIDMSLVNAYQARRALDYLMGYSLSPLLIRKFPGCKSAGRVQSVALKLISERENEIQKFNPIEYWNISIELTTDKNEKIEARLKNAYKSKIGKLDIKSEKEADKIIKDLKSSKLFIKDILTKQKQLSPSPPFITSSLQLEANNRLGFSPKVTMSLAQKLYEGININGENQGLITYMRTDSTNLSIEFITEARNIIKNRFGKEYLNETIRNYKNKVKNAQEAHEAIRPSDPSISPEMLPKNLDNDLINLYSLIWKRSLASQSSNAISETLSINIEDEKNNFDLYSSFTKIVFLGFRKIYNVLETNTSFEKKVMEQISKNSILKNIDCLKSQHFTEPPPRYSETSLIKKLEEYGIGRPSTYAKIMEKNQQRGYVKLISKRFHPQPSGRIVTTFLDNYFNLYMDYNFTAQKEDELDLVSQGEKDWKSVLYDFWDDFSKRVDTTLKLSNTNVYDYINEAMKEYLFPKKEGNTCPCGKSNLSIKMRKNGSGPFVACTNYPECDYIRSEVFANEKSEEELFENKVLGKDNDVEVLLKKGPYGPYVQLGSDKEDKKSLKRASIPKNISIKDINLSLAKDLLALPREVGKHPETGEIIIANNGRYGPYLKYNSSFFSIPKDENPLTIGLNRAMDILSKPKRGNRKSVKPIRNIGKHPKNNKDISLYEGKYGHYIKFNSLNYSIPKKLKADQISLDEALIIITKK